MRGFDSGIFELLARYILGDASKYEVTQVTSSTREAVLQSAQVDVVVATYSITDKRKELISFAGPYYTSRQAVLVKAGNKDISGVNGLEGKRVATQHARDEGSEADKIHSSSVLKPSFVYDIFGKTQLTINSAHHQAIKTLGKGLCAVQYSNEGIIEAVEHDSLPFYALQWHPERLCLSFARSDAADGLKVFDWLINSL